MARDREVLTAGGPLREDVTLAEMEDEQARLKAEDEARKKKEEEDQKRKEEEERRASQPPDPRVTALENALRISEDARKREAAIRDVGGPPKPTEPEKKKLSKEELKKLHDEDPLAAMEYMITGSLELVSENINRRLEPLMQGGATTARAAMEAKYPDEFALFGNDIEVMLKDPRLNQAAMGNLQAWEDMLSFVRGKPGNLEKLISHRQKKTDEQRAREAQNRQLETGGAHVRTETRTPAPTGDETAELDATEKEIAKGMADFLAPGGTDADAEREYKRWRRVTR